MSSERHEQLGDVVRERRVALGLSQQDLAEVAGVSLPSVNVLENARQSRYRTWTLRKIGGPLGWLNGELARFMSDETYELPQPMDVLEQIAEAESRVRHPAGTPAQQLASQRDALTARERLARAVDLEDFRDPDDDPPASDALSPPLELAALSGRLDELSAKQRAALETMIEAMLDED